MCDMHTRPPLLSPTDAIHHFLSCFFCSVPTSIMRTCGPGALLIDRCVRAVCSGVPRLQFTVSVSSVLCVNSLQSTLKFVVGVWDREAARVWHCGSRLADWHGRPPSPTPHARHFRFAAE